MQQPQRAAGAFTVCVLFSGRQARQHSLRVLAVNPFVKDVRTLAAKADINGTAHRHAERRGTPYIRKLGLLTRQSGFGRDTQQKCAACFVCDAVFAVARPARVDRLA